MRTSIFTMPAITLAVLMAPVLVTAQSVETNDATTVGTQPTTITTQTTEASDVAEHAGHALVKHKHARSMSGTVTAVNGTTLSVMLNDGTTVTVDVSTIKLARRFGATMEAADFQNGDHVVMHGTLDGNTVTASWVRDASLQARNAVFGGTVSAVNGSGFTLATKERGTQTVNTSATTIFKKNGESASLSDVTVGAMVKVSGVWDRTNNNVTASKVMVVIRMKPVHLTGTIAAIANDTLTVTGTDGTTYTVDLSHAHLVRRFGGKSSASEFSVGDSVMVNGRHATGSAVITAKVVRDTTITLKTVEHEAESENNTNTASTSTETPTTQDR